MIKMEVSGNREGEIADHLVKLGIEPCEVNEFL